MRLAVLCVSDAWCLGRSEMGVLRMSEIHDESNVWNTVHRLQKSC